MSENENKTWPKVSIVIPLYKITPLFYQCMESLNKISYPNWEIIVMRTDGSFAENCNRGIKASKGSKYVLLLNDDTVVTPDFLQPLVELMESDEEIIACSPKMLFPDGRVQFGGMVFHEDYFAGHLGWGWKNDDPRLLTKPTEMQATTFGCVIIRNDMVLHLLDEQFKIGGFEDVDWCLRAKLQNWKIFYQPESFILHYESQTFRSMDQFKRSVEDSANRKLYMDKWKPYFENGTFKVDDKDFEGGVWKGFVEE